MSDDPSPTRKRRQTETITMLLEQSRAVMMDAEALRALSRMMLNELHRMLRRADGVGDRLSPHACSDPPPGPEHTGNGPMNQE